MRAWRYPLLTMTNTTIRYLLQCDARSYLVGDGRVVGAYRWDVRARAERYSKDDATAIVDSIVSRHPSAHGKIKMVAVFA